MALTVTGVGSGATTTTGTSVAVTLTSSVAVNDVLVACVAVNNNGTSGAAPSSLACADSKGNGYQSLSAGLVDPGAASAGAYGAMFVSAVATAMTTSDTVTVTVGSAAAMAVNLYKVTPGSGKLVYLGSTGGATTTAGTSATTTTGSLASGEAVIGMTAIERGNSTKNLSVTADSDTSNGSWSAQVASQGNNSATSTSDMTLVSQAKVTSGAGTQTYNVAWTTSTDAVIRYITFVEGDPLLTGVPIPFAYALWAGDPNQSAPSDGAAVASWRSGGWKGGSFAQGTGTAQPTYDATNPDLKNKPAIKFAEFDDQLVATGNGSHPLPFTLLVVTRSGPSGSGPTVKLIGTNGAELGINPTPSMFAYAGGTGVNINAAGAYRTSATNFVAAALIASGSNGKLIAGTTAAGATTQTGNTGTSTGPGVVVGNTNTGNTTEGWNGWVTLAAVYYGDLTAHPNYSDLVAFIDTEWLSTSLSATIGQVTETDTAQTLTRAKAKVIGQNLETDTAQAVTRRTALSATIAQTSETDLAQTLTRVKRRAAGQAAETDTAQAIAGRAKAKAIAQTTETDLAQPATRVKRRVIGQTTEADAVGALGRLRARLTGQTTETDTTGALGRLKRRLAGQAVETDTATTATRRKAKAIGQNLETDLAQPVTRPIIGGGTIGQTIETDAAQALARAKRKATAQAFETDLAQPAGRRKARTAGQAAEVDTAQLLGRVKRRTLGQSLEVDTANGATRRKARTIGQPAESDLARPATAQRLYRVAVGQATELNAAQAVIYVNTGGVLAWNGVTGSGLATTMPTTGAFDVDDTRVDGLVTTSPTGTGLTTPTISSSGLEAT